jgi:hypothetical protein
MNENIKKLADQCTSYNNSDGWMFDQEKFAELIIKECYEHCKGQLLNSTLAKEHNLSYNDGVADCAIGLLQHFGVK